MADLAAARYFAPACLICDRPFPKVVGVIICKCDGSFTTTAGAPIRDAAATRRVSEGTDR